MNSQVKSVKRSTFLLIVLILLVKSHGSAQTYCTAGANNCDEHISKVEINTISKSSNCGLGSNGVSGYSDYTSISTTLIPDSNYTVKITNGVVYSGDYIDLYFDWNGDKDFTDANEYIGSINNSPATFNVTVPSSGITVGPTVMRARCRYYGSHNSCGILSWGEVEDYTVIIAPLFHADAGVISVDSPAYPLKPGLTNVKVRIQNYGKDTLKSAGIDWKINSTSKSGYSWSGSLPSGTSSSQVLLGNHYFTTGAYTIKTWTKNPNAVADSNAFNDTFTLNIYSCYPLSGTYTIGKDASDSFASFSAAVDKLIKCGISGPVVFNVDSGSYNEQFTIPEIKGVNATNTITFKSATSDSSDVIVYYSATSSLLNYVVKLDGADYIKFEKINLKATGTNYGKVLFLTNTATNNTFNNNIIENSSTSSTSENLSLVFSDASLGTDSNNTFQQNYFLNGSYGILFYANNTAREKNNIVKNNHFKNQYEFSIYFEFQNSHQIIGNIIQSFNTNNYYYAIYIYNCNGNFKNLQNKIEISNSSSSTGIYLDYCLNDSANHGLTANNFIHVMSIGNYNSYGINVYYCNYQDILYNSVNVTGNYLNTYALYYYGNDNNIVKNNIFCNKAGGYSIYSSNTTGLSSDYNDLYTTGTYIGYWNSQITGLTNWISTTKQDSHSVSVNPYFLSENDLHTFSNDLNGKAKPITAISIDIDNESRSSTSPDIGADEFNVKSRDIGIVTIDNPKTPAPPGINDFKVKFKNFGLDTIKTATIEWKYDGNTKSSKSWSGSLKTGDTSSSITVDTVTVSLGDHTVKVWTKNPNGSGDLNPANDTLIYTFKSCVPLNGTYTIGPNPGDSFSSLTNAVNAMINRCGVSGPVTFKIASGTYIEQVTIPEILGASATNTITFTSAANDSSQVNISYSSTSYSNNFTVKLNGADYIIFKNVSITATNSSYGRVVFLQGGANHNKFLNCKLTGYNGSSTSTYNAIVYMYENNNIVSEYNTFSNNFISYGSYGFYIYNDYGEKAHNNEFISNYLYNQYYSGFYSQYQLSPAYEKNIVNTNSSYSYFYGFYLYQNDEELKLKSNKLSAPNVNGGMGIYLYYCNGTSTKKSLISNNFIHLNNLSNYAYGINMYSSTYQQLFYNSVNLTGSSSNGTGFYYYNWSGNTGNIILNNIFSCKNGVFAVEFNANRPDSCDFNNYFTTGATLGIDLGNNKSTISAWKSSTGKDQNSLSLNPDYLTNSDLHISNLGLNGKAIPIAIVPKDIDDENRNTTTPDIGADEFIPPANDAGVYTISNPTGVFSAGSKPVKITLKNHGTDTLKSVSVDWKINGTAQTTYNWSGNLPPNQTDTNLTIGTFNFARGNFAIKVWTKNPNNSTDGNKNNDTQEVVVNSTNLCDTFTIGGTSPDFVTIKSAVDTLKTYGICGPVVFLIRPGTYNEQIEITSIIGTSATNTVTFTSSNGDSTSVILTYSPSSSTNNYVLFLNSADYLHFYKLSIKNIGSSYGTAIRMYNNAIYNLFSNCIIESPSVTSTSSNYSVIYSNTSDDNNNTFNNNIINNGSIGIYWYGSSNESSNTFSNNTFNNQYYSGIYIGYNYYLSVIGNTINTTSNYSYYYGMQLNYNYNHLQILQNKISKTTNGGYGIYMYYCYGSISDYGLIANNFISLYSTSYDAIGLYLYYNQYQKYYYNSINITGNNTNSRAVYFSGYSSVLSIFKNNNFINQCKGYAFYTYSTSFQSDYNNFLTDGSFIAYYNSNNITSFLDWQSATAKDSHSVNINPDYFSATDLHTFKKEINGKAIVISEVTKDIDNENRNTSTPDIGADEFTPPNVDAGIISLDNPTLPAHYGNQSVKVSLKNFSTDTLKSVTIEWQLDGTTKTPYSWSGTIVPDDTAKAITLGSITLSYGSHSLKIWTKNPNGTVDGNKLNDTLLVNFFAKNPLNGVYTIGPLSSDSFSSFQEAVDSLVANGVSGPVTMNVSNGTYTEQIIIPEITGASASRPIIFQSTSGDSTKVILQYNEGYSNNYIIALNGADYFTFRKMTIKAINQYYSRVIILYNSATNNTLSNLILEAPVYSTTSDNSSLIYSYSTGCNNNKIQSNYLKNSAYAIYFYSYNSSYKISGLQITNNILNNPYYMGIYLGFNESPQVTGNTISTNSAYSTFYGMYFYYPYNELKVQSNKISVYNTYSIYGIIVYYHQGTSTKQGNVSNNFISSVISDWGYGIYCYDDSYLNIYYNNINLTGTSTSTTYSIYITYGDNCKVINNIFKNTTGGYAIYANSNYSMNSCDYNCFYSNGSYMGYFNGNRATISNWQSASGFDYHSKFVDPLYISSSDLHVKEISIDNSGTPISGITTDIDGETRNTTKPDIGADEFSPPTNDAGLVSLLSPVEPFTSGNQLVIVRLRNFGSDTLKTVKINWKINNITRTTYNWSGSLKSGDTIYVIIGNHSFSVDSTYAITAWTNQPNGSSDLYTSNDSITVTDLHPALQGVYTIGGTSPNFTTFTAAVNALKSGGIIGTVTFNVRNGKYTEQIEIPDIIGASSDSSIIFQSEALDSTKVTLQYSANSAKNYTLLLNGADGIIFRKMTIKSLNTNYGRVIELSNNSNNNCFEFNQIEGYYTTSSSSQYTIIYNYYSNNNNLKITNNLIKRSSYGFYLFGTSGYQQNVYVENNIFDSITSYGIYAYYQNNLTIHKNTFKMNTSSNYIMGFVLDNVYGKTTITNNKLDLSNGVGMYVYNSTASSSTPGVVSNNFISIGTGYTDGYGLEIYYAYYFNFYYNSINVYNTATSSEGLYIYGGSNNNIVNNIIACTGGGWAYYVSSPSSINNSDYNCFYTTGSNLAYWNGTHTSLSSLRTASSKDMHSLVKNPLYVSYNDLHIQEVALNKAATPISGITKDIDEDTRDNVRPDIGADEFSPPLQDDAGVTAIISPQIPFNADSNDVKVILTNYGSDTLKSATIKWTVNGVAQTQKNWTGVILTGDSDTLSLGKYKFNLKTEYIIVAYSVNPNGAADSFNTNDTSTLSGLYAALNGTYTIGGSSPDFGSFSDAVFYLCHGGVLGPVTFNVRSGYYSEKISITAYPGASVSKPVIFQSETSDSTQVYLSYNTDASNYTILLDGANYITFRKMTIRSTSTGYYGIVIQLKNGANYNNFINNILQGVNVSTTSESYSVVYNGGYYCHHNKFENNIINYGSNSIYLYGTSSSYATGNIIKNNILNQPYYRGIYMTYQDNPELDKNKISLINCYFDAKAIELYYCQNSIRISGNFISVDNGSIGIYMYNCNGTTSYRGLIYNNFVHVNGTYNPVGINLYFSNYQNLYYNNINLTNISASNGKSVYFYSCSNLYVQNNNIINNGNGYAIMINNISSTISNYNNLYTTGSYLAYNGSNLSNLSSYKAATGLDNNSLSVDPQYYSNSDLHVREITLNEAGTVISGITKDIDDETRSNTKPDIGADEFKPPFADDAGIVSLVYPTVPFPADTLGVKVILKNFGSDTLKTVSIKWIVNNNNQSQINWTGSILPGKTDTVLLGNYIFKTGISYHIVLYTINPNGIRDSLNTNDTTEVTNLYAGLNGTYTIGGTNPDFTNFTSAVNILVHGGVVGSVLFKVRTGVYNEQLTFTSIPGSSSSNTITFESEGKDSNLVTLAYNASSASNYVVRLLGCSYVTFKHMTFQPLHNYYSTAVLIEGNSHHNNFQFNRFEGVSTNVSYSNLAVIYSDNGVDEYNTFQNNVIRNGSYGIYFNSPSTKEYNNIISNNVFEGQYYCACFLNIQSGVEVSNNTISSSSTNYLAAIYIQSSNNGVKIFNNKIAAEKGQRGIYLYEVDGTSSNYSNVYNNFIQVGGTSTSIGIQLYYIDYMNVFYNSVNVTGTSLSLGRSVDIPTYSSSLYLRNNIFANTGGGYCIYSGSTSSLASSNYNDLFTTGSVLGYWSGDKSNLSAWRSSSGHDNNSKSVDPLFFSSTDLHISQVLLDSSAIPVSGFTKDIDNQTRNANYPDIGADEFTYIGYDVGITAILNPVTSCGLTNDSVKVKIQNFGGLTQSNFNVAFKVDNNNPIVRNIGSKSITKGSSLIFTFDTVANVSSQGNHKIVCYTLLSYDTIHSNDTLTSNFVNYPVLSSAGNMLPIDSALNVALPITFSWSPVTNATSYDLYLWLDTVSRPTTPTVSNLTQITHTYNGSLLFGKKYRWQIIAKNAYCQSVSNIQKFTVRNLPDLIVNSVTVPSTAYSGQTFNVSWQIKNTGTGSTLSNQWYDIAYLSQDATLDVNVDYYLGGVSNMSSLSSGQSYNQTSTFTIPQGLSGYYYVIIVTDYYTALQESDENNNKGNNTSTMTVILTPPPDLQVTAIVRPNNVYSGTTANISWTVKNTGNGNTVTNYWYDAVYMGQDTTFDPANCYYMGVVYHNGQLTSNSTYSTGKTINIPNAIFGTYYIFVKTDIYNNEYEHAMENNNVLRSAAMNIILTPPPDLAVQGILIPDTISNSEQMQVEFYLKNQGGNDPESYWNDRVYLSASKIFNENNAINLGDLYHSANLDPGKTDTLYKTIIIPNNLNGKYYIFIKTDINNTVYEYTYENNNVSSPDSVIIISPDLQPYLISNTNTAYSGTNINISWKDKNNGPGKLISRVWKDKVYISSTTTFNVNTAVLLKEISIPATTLIQGGTKTNTTTITIPNGYSGTYYLFIHTDANNDIFEAGIDNNNIKKSDTNLVVTLSPWPDLRVVKVDATDTATAGDAVAVSFTVKNNGTASAGGSSWKDKIYLSKDAVLNVNNATFMKEMVRAQALAVNDSFNMTTMISLNAGLTAGKYYLHVYTDADDNIYEHSDNNNNITSKSIQILPYPPIDYAINSVTSPDTGSSGKSISISYIVKNIGQGKSLAPNYYDAIYLSTDSIWSPATDILVNREQMNTQLQPNTSYTKNISVTLPNGISGNYYLLMITDEQNHIVDVNRSNNYRSRVDTLNKMKKMYIKLTLTPDLKVNTVSYSPASGTAGQPINVTWTVKNQGQAATGVSYEDRIYLSTDFNVDGSDIYLGNYQRTTSLAINGTYTQSQQFFIPGSVTGNYIVLVFTDASNAEYEHNAENNNVTGASINISAAPPSDLIVSTITVPSSAVAGDYLTLNYKLKNIGNNPSTGYVKDAIYISSDSIWDVNDILFGTSQHYISLAKNAETQKSINAALRGVTLGHFKIIVRTDILDYINESNDNNNEKVSTDSMKVNVQNLPWYTLTFDTLYDNSEVYFKLESHDTLKTETLLLTLKGDSVNGDNELYLKYLGVPTRNTYDYSYSKPFSGNQEIIVPSLNDSTYYMMIYGYTTVGSLQKISLFAKILHFELRSIEAKEGGNTGKVTVILQGSKFDTTMSVWLKNDSATYYADTIVYVDPATAFVTFDLAGAKIGTYNVFATKTSKADTAKIINGFKIVAGVAPDLQVSISKPANVRPSAITAMSVDFANAGNTDIDIPNIILKSLALAPVGMSVPDLENKKTQLTFLLKELKGPQWVLRPGAMGSVLIYTKSTTGLGFQIMLPEVK